MKRIWTFVLAAVLMAAFAGAAFAANWQDSGVPDTSWYKATESSFTITTPAQLAGLAKLVNEGTTFSGKTVKIGKDISLTGKEWTPIGKRTDGETIPYAQLAYPKGNYFEGVFDGCGYSITGLAVSGSSSYQGLFSLIASTSAEIKNFSLTGSVKGNSYLGLIAGCTYASITNCTVSGSVKVDTSPKVVFKTTQTDGRWVGGVVGFCNDSEVYIINCVSHCDVTGYFTFGGIAGSGKVFGCKADGTVSSPAGFVKDEDLFEGEDSYNDYGAYERKICAYNECGGLVGTGYAVSSISTATVTAPNVRSVGGLVGSGWAANCVFEGNVTGYAFVGGIIGGDDPSLSSNNGNLVNCYARGTITAHGSDRRKYTDEKSSKYNTVQNYIFAGGIAGGGAHNLINCVSDCTVTNTINENAMSAGGLAGDWEFTKDAASGTKYTLYNCAWTGSGAAFGRLKISPAEKTYKIIIGKELNSLLESGNFKNITAADAQKITVAVIPENSLVSANNSTTVKLVGYPKADAAANITAKADMYKYTYGNTKVSASGAQITITGLENDCSEALYSIALRANSVTAPASYVGTNYVLNCGYSNAATDVNNTTPMIAAEELIGVIGSTSGKKPENRYPNEQLRLSVLRSYIMVTGVTVTPSTLNMAAGEAMDIKATVLPATAMQTVTWKSSNEKVAQVIDGRLFANTAGTATLTATSTVDTTKSGTCTVTVHSEVSPTTPTITDSSKIPANVDISKETKTYSDIATAVAAMSSDITAADLEKDEDGCVYIKKDAAKKIIEASLAESEDVAQIDMLPIFSVAVASGKKVAASAWNVSGYLLKDYADTFDKLDLRKIIGGALTPLKFTYTADAAQYSDGKFTILNSDGSVPSTTAIDGSKQYQLLLFIADNGSYDLNKTSGIVTDPAVLVKTEESSGPGGSGSGGGGCSAGYGALSLMLALPLAIFKRKRHK